MPAPADVVTQSQLHDCINTVKPITAATGTTELAAAVMPALLAATCTAMC